MELNKCVEFGTFQKLSFLEQLSELNYEYKKLELWQQSGFPDLLTEVTELKSKYIVLSKAIIEILDFVELNVIAMKKCLKKWDKVLGQQAGLSLLSRFETTHLNTFLEINELAAGFIEIKAKLGDCDKMAYEVRTPNRLKLSSNGYQAVQSKLSNAHRRFTQGIGMGRSISVTRFQQ